MQEIMSNYSGNVENECYIEENDLKEYVSVDTERYQYLCKQFAIACISLDDLNFEKFCKLCCERKSEMDTVTLDNLDELQNKTLLHATNSHS